MINQKQALIPSVLEVEWDTDGFKGPDPIIHLPNALLRKLTRENNAGERNTLITNYLSDEYDYCVNDYHVRKTIRGEDIPPPTVTVIDTDTGEQEVISMTDIIREINIDHFTSYTTLNVESVTVFYPDSRTEYRFLSINMDDRASYYWQHNLNPKNLPRLVREPA